MAYHEIFWTWNKYYFVVVFCLIFSLFLTVSANSYQNEEPSDLFQGISKLQVIKFDQSEVGLGLGRGSGSNLITDLNKQEEVGLTRRRRRGTDEGSCTDNPITNGEQAKLENLQTNFTFKDDTNFNLALVWLGEDGQELLALTTIDFGIFVGPSNLWISNNYGRTFVNKNDEINNAIIRENYGINKSPDPRKIIFVGFEKEDFTKTVLFTTENSGGTFFNTGALPFYLDGPLVYHPHRSDYILAHSSTDQFSLWLSTDFGRKWNLLERWVHTFRWGERTEKDYNIYIVVDRNEMKNVETLDLVLKCQSGVSSSSGFKVLLNNLRTFGVQDKFLFASVEDDEKHGTRSLQVSTDDGRSWNKAVLPSLKDDMFYSVLDSSEGMIFLHVDEAGNSGYGQLYTSDKDGLIFSQSLERHLYPNGGDVTDFYRVESIRGVYLASQILEDQSVRTKITFNRGAEWRNVNIDSNTNCDEQDETCNLQIHNKYSISQGVNIPMGPLSNRNAVGIILVHGHFGTELHTSDPDVYITENGGYSWRKVLDGPHHYAITNYGALIVAIPLKTSTNIIKYSVDSGQCWHKYTFTDTPVAVTGLLPEPNFRSLKVSVWGYDMETRIWSAYNIDFNAVLERTCSDNDFEKWKPHVTANNPLGCLLGYSESFRRIKRGARCTVDINYEHQVYLETQQCECTRDDYECDFGFKRDDGEGQCKLDGQYRDRAIDICVNNEEEQEKSQGYRLIPGDNCNGGFQPQRNLQDLHESCDQLNFATRHNKHTGLKVGIVLLVILCAVGIGFIYIKRHTLSLPCFTSRDVMYRYSELSSKDELDNELDKALNLDEHSHVYHDESDDDMLT